MVDVDDSCQFSADSQPKSISLVWGLAATRRSVYIHQMNRVNSHHSMFTRRILYVTPNLHCQRAKVSKKSAANTEPRLKEVETRWFKWLTFNRWRTVVSATWKYDDPRLNMSHEGAARVWHVQPRVVIFPFRTNYRVSFVAVIPKPRNFFFAVLRKRQKTYYKTKFAFVLPIHNCNVYS